MSTRRRWKRINLYRRWYRWRGMSSKQATMLASLRDGSILTTWFRMKRFFYRLSGRRLVRLARPALPMPQRGISAEQVRARIEELKASDSLS